MLPLIGGWFAKSVLMQSPIGGLLKAVPRQAWIALAIAAALGGAVLWHQHRAHVAIAAAVKSGADAANAVWVAKIAHVAAEAERLRKGYETLSASIAKEERSRNEQEAHTIAGRADAVRLQGPGAAASHCGPVDHPGLPVGAGGRDAGRRIADATGPAVPASDWSTVPWEWLANRAKQCDLNRAETLTWRHSDAEQRAAWEKMRTAPQAR